MTDEDAFFEHARREMFPKMASSACVISILSATPDPKLCLELGAALLFDKPIIAVTIGEGFPIPARLRRLFVEHVHIDDDESLSEGPGAARLQAAIGRHVDTGRKGRR